MSIEVRRIDEPDRWNGFVERSPQATILHRYEALTIQAAHSGSTLIPLAGFKGQEPVGIFPVFELSKGPVTGVFSPPPGLWVQKLGPAYLNMGKLKQRKAERRRKRFVDGAFEWIDAETNPRIVRFHTPDGMDDPRPFKWNDCEVTPEFTYVTDLGSDPEALMDRFSSDARSNIRNNRDGQFTIELGEGADILRIMEQVQNRYDSQDKDFGVPPEFPRDLWTDLPDGSIRPYVFRADGEFYGGILAYDDGETVARWYGGVKPDEEIDLPINDLLDWHVMEDAIDRDRSYYDLVGAGNHRLNRYKAKFAPELRTFYGVERTNLPMKYLLGMYRKLPKP